MKNAHYTYGDEVKLTQIDASGNTTKTACYVVGITPVDTHKQSLNLGYPLGTVLYTVEFSDGSDQLVAEERLSSD